MKEGRSINLQNEGKLSEITHYNVIRLQGFYFKDDGNQVLLMEYMRGMNFEIFNFKLKISIFIKRWDVGEFSPLNPASTESYETIN